MVGRRNGKKKSENFLQVGTGDEIFRILISKSQPADEKIT